MTAKTIRPGPQPRPASDLSPMGRQLRKLRGDLTPAEAAGKCSMSGDWWSNKETGRREVSVADLQTMAIAFGVTWSVDARGAIVFSRG